MQNLSLDIPSAKRFRPNWGEERGEPDETYWFHSWPNIVRIVFVERRFAKKKLKSLLESFFLLLLRLDPKISQFPSFSHPHIAKPPRFKNFNLDSKIYLFMFYFCVVITEIYYYCSPSEDYLRDYPLKASSRLPESVCRHFTASSTSSAFAFTTLCCVSNSKLDTYFIFQSIESFSKMKMYILGLLFTLIFFGPHRGA